MREIPIVFPISLAIILVMILFTSAYAVSYSAVEGSSVYSTTGAVVSTDTGASADSSSGSYNWYQQTALFVCPLH